MSNQLFASLAIVFGVALTGCQSTPQAVQNKEDLLAAAGFCRNGPIRPRGSHR